MSITRISDTPSTTRPSETGGADASRSGAVGDRAVTTEGGARPRAAENRTVLQRAADLFSRAIGTAGGAERRAVPQAFSDMTPQKRQAVVDKMDKHLGKALAELGRKGGDGVRAQQGATPFRELGRLAAAVADDPAGRAALDRSIADAVSRLPFDRQVAALNGIRSDQGARLQGLLTDPHAERALMILEHQLGTAVLDARHGRASDAAAGVLGAALERADGSRGRVLGTGLQEAFSQARNEIRAAYDDVARLGLRPRDVDTRESFIATEMLRLIDGSGQPDRAVSVPLLLGLDTGSLQAMNTTAVRAGHEEAVGEIASELQRRLAEKLDVLPRQVADVVGSHPADAVADPDALLADLAPAADTIAAGRRFADRAGLTGMPFDAARQALASHVDGLVRDGRLDVGGMTDAALHRLEMALKAIGSGDAAARATGEADERRATLRGQYHQSLDVLLGALRDGTPAAVLQATRSSGPVRDEVAAALEPLGLCLDGADEMMAAREMLMATRLADLPTDDLERLHDRLTQPDMRNLAAGLPELAYDVMTTDRDLFSDMFNMGTDLMLLRGAVERQLADRGAAVPPQSDGATAEGLAAMDAGGFAALRDVLGIDAGPGGLTRFVSGPVRGTAASDFATAVTAPPQGSQTTPGTIGGVPAGVSEIFLKDFSRMTYTSGGTELFDGARGDGALRDGIEALRGALGGDDDLLFAVSQYANQAALAPLAVMLLGDDSPLMLETGVAGNIVSGAEGQRTSFDIALTQAGEATIDVSFTAQGQRFMGSDGSMQWLQRDHGTATFTFQLTVDRTGTAQLTQPLRFDGNLRSDPTWPAAAPYARPNTLVSITEFLRNAEPELRADLQALAEQEYSTENLDFYDALQAYRAAPDATAANTLFNTFVDHGAPRLLNMPSTTRNAVHAALTANATDPNAFARAEADALANIADTISRLMSFLEQRYA